MVLQRYALRFTISDATLDSLKLPRSTSKHKPDPLQVDKEHKTTSPVTDSETTEPLHKPEPTIPDQMPAEPEEMEMDTTLKHELSLSVASSSATPVSPLSPFTNKENVPPQSLQFNEPQSTTESPTTQQKQPITGDSKPQIKPLSPQIAQPQPHTTQPVHTTPPVHTLSSPSSVSPRPVPMLAAKPYCQPRSTQSGHKPVKVRAP